MSVVEFHGAPETQPTVGGSFVPADLEMFIDLIGARAWGKRIGEIVTQANAGGRAGRAVLQKHCIELTIRRLLLKGSAGDGVAPTPGELRIAARCQDAVDVAETLPAAGLERMREVMRAGLDCRGTLVPLFHMLHTAALQQARGFDVAFAGWSDAAPFDLLIERDGCQAEIACEVISAEAGRDLHSGAWFRLVDRVDPELQTWLASHPGRYVLKMTLPQGLRDAEDGVDPLALLHTRITALLKAQRRNDYDEAAMMRLDPLMLLAAQADELGLMPRLRQEFGPEAHLAVTAAGNGVFVMAARAGRADTVAAAVRERLAAIAPARLSGQRPGILAMFIEDADRRQWRGLRDQMELEAETRQFLTQPGARNVVAVTCTSRLELFGIGGPDSVEDGDLRFRNQAHPAAKSAALAPAVLSSV